MDRTGHASGPRHGSSDSSRNGACAGSDELSKGMQQKVQFILDRAHDPDLLILDERFSGLICDAQVMKDTVLDLRSRGKTILFSTTSWSRPKTVRAAVHHCAGAEAGGWRALGYQADTERTPSRDRVRRKPQVGRASVCRKSL